MVKKTRNGGEMLQAEA